MVEKRKIKMSGKAHKYKIVSKLDFGPYADLKTANLVKKKLKAKLKKTVFGSIKKIRGGYMFEGRNTHVTPAVIATAEAIKNQIKAKAPEADITVTRI